jgi:hypothetical protein
MVLWIPFITDIEHKEQNKWKSVLVEVPLCMQAA